MTSGITPDIGRASPRIAVALATLQITRPITWIAVAVAVQVGASLTSDPNPGRTWLAVLVGAAAVAASNAFNDLKDVGVDSLNRPLRPLPAGAVSVRVARLVVTACSVASVGAAFALGPSHAVVAIGLLATAFAYSASLQHRVILSNIVVAGLLGAVLPYGAWAASGSVPGSVWLASSQLVAFIIGREILKDVVDVLGDGAAGTRTLATVKGVATSVNIAQAWFGIYAVTALAPIMLGKGSLAYGAAAISLAVAPSLALIAWLGREHSTARVAVVLRWTAVGFFTGLLVVALIQS